MEKQIPAYRGDGPYVFVCYAHEDADAVFAEIAWLNEQGVHVWYDEGISAGLEWSDALANAIQGCARFIYFVTPNSVVSENCRRELNFAQEEGRDVVAVHLAPTDIPAGLRLNLNNRQAVRRHELGDGVYRAALLEATQIGEMSTPAAAAPVSAARYRRWPGASTVALVVALLVLAAWWFAGESPQPSDPAVDSPPAAPVYPAAAVRVREVIPNSVAVLPFANLSPREEDAYFAAGVHEETINQLAKIRDLSVIARTSVMQYAGVRKPIAAIAEELNVGAVMEGSVRYAGDRVRITAQLIDAATGAPLWSEAYEEDLTDIFAIQLDIATQITSALQATLSPDERRRIAETGTQNPEAYAHFLAALSQWGNYAPSQPVHASLDAAIALDPAFAPALAYKAWVHAIEAFVGNFLGAEFTPENMHHAIAEAERFANRALALDPDQGLAHVALSNVHTYYRRSDQALASVRRAFALDPNDYRVVTQMGLYLTGIDVDRGIELFDRSVELNPADVANAAFVGRNLWFVQRWQESERQARMVTQMAPQAALGFTSLALVKAFTDDPDEARRYAQMAEARQPGPYELVNIAVAYAKIGDQESARRIFDLANAGDEVLVPDLAWQFLMHMSVGEIDQAMAYLERALEENFPPNAYISLKRVPDHPVFDPVRNHPMFDELVRRANQPFEPPAS